MEPNPTCPTCGAAVDLTRGNAVTPVIYRNVACRGCGVICILEGPERNVNIGPSADSAKLANSGDYGLLEGAGREWGFRRLST
jgi:hypothetical protein